MRYDKAEHIIRIVEQNDRRLAFELSYSVVEDAIELFPTESAKALAARFIDAFRLTQEGKYT